MDNPTSAGEEVKQLLPERRQSDRRLRESYWRCQQNRLHLFGAVCKSRACNGKSEKRIQQRRVVLRPASPPPSGPQYTGHLGNCSYWHSNVCDCTDAQGFTREVAPPSGRPAEPLREALRVLYEETADYIRINNLGDIHHNRSMQMARDALSLAAPKSSTLGEEMMTWFCANPSCSFATNIPPWPGDEFRPASKCPQCKGSRFKTFAQPSASAPDAGQPGELCIHCGQIIFFQKAIPPDIPKGYWFSRATGNGCPKAGQYNHAPSAPASAAREQLADMGRKAGFHVTACNYICQEVNVETLARFGDLYAAEPTRQLREELAFVYRVLRIAWEYDVAHELLWSFHDDKFSIAAICSDTFYWGCADAEDITPENVGLFEQTLKECEALKTDNEFPILCAAELFAARVRKMRPQGASYATYPLAVWPLFHVCGPEREVGLGNPYSLEKAAERAKDKETKYERRDKWETLLQRAQAAEAEREKLLAEIAVLRGSEKWLKECCDDYENRLASAYAERDAAHRERDKAQHLLAECAEWFAVFPTGSREFDLKTAHELYRKLVPLPAFGEDE